MLSTRSRTRLLVIALTVAGGLAVVPPTSAVPQQAARGVSATATEPRHAGTPRQRADRLVARMTLDEKIAMVHGDTFPPTGTWAGHVPGVPRLGIPALYLGDGPNGVGNGSTGVTQFPAAVSTAASWDPALARAFGSALGAEQRGKGHNVALAPTLNILRTPLWGREAETFTEDPYLDGRTAAAEIRGIQSHHVIATAKHFVANNQETGRVGVPPGGRSVDERISTRALQEIYLPGFKAAVQQGRAGAVMCAYQRINGEYACQDRSTLAVLKRRWGYGGFVMSDWVFAIRDAVAAARAGSDMEMPLGTNFGDSLKRAVVAGQVPMSRLDDMVARILTSMIRLGLMTHPVDGVGAADVSTPAHRSLAAGIAERGSVLLRNRGVLPLSGRVRSLAVIGAAADAQAQYTEGGSGAVIPSHTVSPLEGIRDRAPQGVRVDYAAGTLGTDPLPLLSGTALSTPSGATGLRGAYYPNAGWSGAPTAVRTDASIDVTGTPVTGLPAAWSARWTGTLTPTTTGGYRFSLSGAGAYRLWIDGRLVTTDKYADFAAVRQPAPVHLVAGHPVRIRVDYSSAPAITGASFQVGWAPPDPALRQQAVAAARGADVAVVFVNDVTGEGSDRSSLALPGDQDQLIAAVARANPRTVVVLNTGGPVLTPWLGRVAGLLETWYPGQEYGTSIARLLFGDVDPSGRLPMTWPRNASQGPASSYGALGLRRERYAEGLLVGYRWYDAMRQRPRFPFGFGLSYTRFRIAGLHVTSHARRYTVSARVTDTGSRSGAETAQLYVGFPAAAHEPPRQLKGYAKIDLRPGQTRTVRFRIDRHDLAAWLGGRWRVVPGTYRVMLGASSRDVRATGRIVIR